MKSYKLRRVVGLVLALAVISSCGDSNGPANQKGKPQRPAVKPAAVTIQTPEIGTSAAFYITSATVEPSSDAQVFARTAGIARHLYREEGDSVKAGDLLLQLEDDDQKLRVKQAGQKLESAEREFNRLSRMQKAGAVSPTEWEAARTNFETAQTDLELAKLALSYTRVVAPFDGRLVWREVDLGAHVLNGNLLFRVMQVEPLLVRVHVPSTKVGKISKGQSVELKVDGLPDSVIGIVDLVSPIVDPATGTVKVTITLQNMSDRVRPGDFVQVKLVTDQRENAFLLPSLALIEDRGSYHLFVENEGKAVKKTVTVGYVVDDKTEVMSGIKAEDRVIVKGHQGLNEGSPVKILEDSAGQTQQGQSQAEQQASAQVGSQP